MAGRSSAASTCSCCSGSRPTVTRLSLGRSTTPRTTPSGRSTWTSTPSKVLASIRSGVGYDYLPERVRRPHRSAQRPGRAAFVYVRREQRRVRGGHLRGGSGDAGPPGRGAGRIPGEHGGCGEPPRRCAPGGVNAAARSKSRPTSWSGGFVFCLSKPIRLGLNSGRRRVVPEAGFPGTARPDPRAPVGCPARANFPTPARGDVRWSPQRLSRRRPWWHRLLSRRRGLLSWRHRLFSRRHRLLPPAAQSCCPGARAAAPVAQAVLPAGRPAPRVSRHWRYAGVRPAGLGRGRGGGPRRRLRRARIALYLDGRQRRGREQRVAEPARGEKLLGAGGVLLRHLVQPRRLFGLPRLLGVSGRAPQGADVPGGLFRRDHDLGVVRLAGPRPGTPSARRRQVTQDVLGGAIRLARFGGRAAGPCLRGPHHSRGAAHHRLEGGGERRAPFVVLRSSRRARRGAVWSLGEPGGGSPCATAEAPPSVRTPDRPRMATQVFRVPRGVLSCSLLLSSFGLYETKSNLLYPKKNVRGNRQAQKIAKRAAPPQGGAARVYRGSATGGRPGEGRRPPWPVWFRAPPARPARRRGSPTRSTSRRNCGRSRSRGGTSRRTRCGWSARRCGST